MHNRKKRLLLACSLLMSGIIVVSGSALAAGEMSRGLKSSGDLRTGELVSIDQTNDTIGVSATADNVSRLAGVAGAPTIIDIPAEGTNLTIVTSGTAPTLVSDINGTIKKGDRITASPIRGVGMKATISGKIVGTAEADLSNVPTSQRTITDTSGKDVSVRIGQIAVKVAVGDYALPNSSTSRIIPVPLQNIAQGVAGRPVSTFRTAISVLVVVIGFVITAFLTYAAVRTSISAIGRNPLAEHAIRKGLFQVLTTGVIIIISALVIAYLFLVV